MKIKSSLVLLIALFTISCKKDKSNPTPPPAATSYQNVAAGSTWNYHSVDNTGSSAPSDYTITSTSKDTSINSKSYHVYTDSQGGNQYLNVTGNDYYQFDSLPANLGNTIERLYLKDNAAIAANWTQNVSVNIPGSPIPLPVTITNTIAEKGISKTVGATTYTNVIHVSTTIASTLIPTASLTTSIDTYYAPNYGMIENTSVVNLNFIGIVQDLDTQTMLVSADLK